MKTSVLVLGGGPDSEREVSLRSAAAVAAALERLGSYAVRLERIGRIDELQLAALPGDVVFPVLHGPWGEGGGMQDVLERDGRAYVGCRPRAARLAMDKMATKLAAWSVGVPTAPACVLNAADPEPPLGLPCVVKPVHEGSSVGLHICRDRAGWDRATADAARRQRDTGVASMVEALIRGRELTVGLLGAGDGLKALPIVEVGPASGVYDYAAKYERTDTRYVVGPDLSDSAAAGSALAGMIRTSAERVARAIGVRHLCRVDFMLPAGGEPMLLEVNTMPGFTATSLLPKAAASVGLAFEDLCGRLVELALTPERV